MAKELPLSKGKVTIVDDEDYEWLSQWKWNFAQGYAVRGIGPVNARRQVRMHIVILPPPDGMEVDHADGDPLNNTRGNLRLGTHQQNTFNRGLLSNNTSGYKGVSWAKKNKKWRAMIVAQRKPMYLGFYDDAVDAARAYDVAAVLYFGEFARVNFPE